VGRFEQQMELVPLVELMQMGLELLGLAQLAHLLQNNVLICRSNNIFCSVVFIVL
jgi:hypothetical protein